jgi:hypothetical protein
MVKLGVKNFLLIGVMAILFIVMAKVIVNKYPAFNMVAPAINAV